MKTKLSLFLALIILLGCLTACPNASAADNTAVGVESILGGIAVYNERLCGAADEREWVEKGLAASAGIGAEWYVIAQQRLNCAADYSGYIDGLHQYLDEHHISSATSRQKFALVLTACGRGDDAFVASTMDDSIGEQGVMSWIYGLHLLNNGLTSEKYTKEQVIGTLLDLRTPDGGWAVSGEYADVDVTAMAVQALSPYYASNEAVKEAVGRAMNLLSGRQLEDGGFQSYGAENPESVSQVIVALCSLGLDPETDARFIKNGCTMIDALRMFLRSDGSVSHTVDGETNATATVQVYYAMAAVKLLKDGKGNLYVFDTNQSNNVVISKGPLDGIGYKPIACLVALGFALIACAVLFLAGKRRAKNFLFVLLALVMLCALILVTDIHTAREYYSADAIEKGEIVGAVTLEIRCDTVIGKADSDYIPSDGMILPATAFEIDADDTVFDILTEAARKYEIQMENQGSATGAHGMVYIAGINYLYEFDFGDLSGWVYHVNGEAPSVGCGEYRLNDGDVIEWLYTCDLGHDVE